MRNQKLCVTIGTVAAVYLSALAPAGQADTDTVCNEAENSHRGGYVVSEGIIDPIPPAFLREGGSQMSVGNDDAVGLDNAAYRSPALRQCEQDGGPDPT